ncbi:MAG: 30S ribosomal protein S1 [Bacteroidia bacterium]|nr:30S ribosomal protein S1 [Bacteroidia bacterium]
MAEELKAEDVKNVKKSLADYGNEGDTSFDWTAFEGYSADQKNSLEAFYDKSMSSIIPHQILVGTVVGINSKDILVNIGYKSEGVVPRTEFRYNPDVKIGDTVEVYVEDLENKDGQLQLSHKKARALKAWDRVNEAFTNDELITGFVKCRTKGGLIVDVFGLEAFLPGSQIDVKPIRDYDVYVGKNMEFKVVKINQEFKNVVVSHKILLEEELEQQKKDIISKLEKGQILEGIVKNITSYGVFIDLGGVDGLIHITDLSWGRINHPEEIVKLDEKINVVVLDYDDEKKRIALGLKQLTAHPWEQLDANLKPGDKVTGKVVVLADYGAFVEIAPGVEGLIHVSEMSYSSHLRSAGDFVKVGDDVTAVILTLDREERKMSLGLKQLKDDPWTNIQEKYPIGSKQSAVVKNFTNYGIFVELEEGVDGLIHISDLSWTKKIKHPGEITNINDKIDVVVLEIDQENRKLSLGHKQLESDPWEAFGNIFEVGTVQEGTVVEKTDKGMVVALQYGIEGFAPNKHLKKEDGSTIALDEKAEFKVIEFNKDEKKLIVSHTKVWEADKEDTERTEKVKEAKATAKGVDKLKKGIEKTTLGDLSVLADLKEEMEKGSKGKKKKSDEDAE